MSAPSDLAARTTGYRSRFGGLWPDRVDAEAELRARRLGPAQEAQLAHWMREGYLLLERAVDARTIAAFDRDVDRLWTSRDPRVYVDYFEQGERRTVPIAPEHRDRNVKVLDLYGALESARRVAFADAIVEFLRLLFERDPLAFQSLYFRLGSEQPMHQDTAYVQVHPPMEFIGCWVALEDVQPGSGELEYYAGSHRIQEWLWDGEHKWMPPEHPEHDDYLAFLHEQARARELRRISFLPRAGDVLLWHADLAHGGSARRVPDSTRRSLVTHFCPLDREPSYFHAMPHSEKIRHASGASYCYAKRWPLELDAARPRGLRRLLSFGRAAR